MYAPQEAEVQMKNRYNFGKYFSEHDKRRGTNFVKTFPELEEFFNFCKISIIPIIYLKIINIYISIS